jgi:glutamine synthetase
MKKQAQNLHGQVSKEDGKNAILGADRLEAFVVDVNGCLRGKWIPRDTAGKIFKAGLRLPRSAFAFDIWGQDVISAGLVAETGDNDGVCHPVMETLQIVPWAEEKTAQVLMTMVDEKGKPFFGDPRAALAKVVAAFKKEGLTPVVAAELEFYLLDAAPDEWGMPQPPLSPVSGKRSVQAQTYGMGEVTDFSAVLADISAACATQGIPADTTISENGPAQYEINLNHVDSALAAADYATLLKRAVKGVAAKHGMMASFMAKPYGDKSGSGMHVHFSILDKKGNNIFAGKDAKGSAALKHAIAGLLATMPDCMAVLAPNANSYRRFRAGSHAPTTMTWGYDNRSASLRIPESDIAATRIEYRVAGADANPYLMLAVMLGAALEGIKAKKNPPPAITGNAYKSGAKTLPNTWDAALAVFEGSRFIDKCLGKDFKKMYLACKRQEKDIIEAQVSSVEHNAYLRDI